MGLHSSAQAQEGIQQRQREGERETKSKKHNLGSKYRKKEKKQQKNHSQQNGMKEMFSPVGAAPGLQTLLDVCCVQGEPGAQSRVPGGRRAASPWEAELLFSARSGSGTCLRPRQTSQHSLALDVQSLVWIILKTEEKLLAVTRVRAQ